MRSWSDADTATANLVNGNLIINLNDGSGANLTIDNFGTNSVNNFRFADGNTYSYNTSAKKFELKP